MRMPKVLIERLDRWRVTQSPLPSRAEAVRRLLDAALAAAKKSPWRTMALAIGLSCGAASASAQNWSIPGQPGMPAPFPAHKSMAEAQREYDA